MKNLRKPCLPPGWYPRDGEKIAGLLRSAVEAGTNAAAAAAPHAGWYYSGAIAARAAAALSGGETDTVAVIGGHLPGGAPPLFAMEDAAATPLGEMDIDTELRAVLKADFGGAEDRWADNTVEVLLPMVKYFFPDSRLLWVRFPSESASFERGKTLANAAAALGRRVKVLASTDLTHYGMNYGFSPKGYGQKALDWMKEVNDRRFIDAVLEGNPEKALERAKHEKSACSAGAVLGAMGFAAALGASDARLVEYGTSAAAEEGIPPDSFVGYAAIRWR